MNAPFKIVFMGTPGFAVPSLDALSQSEIEVAAVVTVADKPAGRGQKLSRSPVKAYALDRGIPILQPVKLRDEAFINQLKEINADLFVVVAFRMLPDVVWNMPPQGSVNLHGSLLPNYRGAAPIHHAVMNGERETGCTTFFLTHEIDTGAMIDQRTLPISNTDTTGDVHDRMMFIGAELLLETVRNIAAGQVNTVKQVDIVANAPLKTAPKLSKEMARINWHHSAEHVNNHIRGLSPFPGAWTEVNGSSVRIFKGHPVTDLLQPFGDTEAPGTIHQTGKRLAVACGDRQYYEVLELQMPGKKRIETASFVAGNSLHGIVFV